MSSSFAKKHIIFLLLLTVLIFPIQQSFANNLNIEKSTSAKVITQQDVINSVLINYPKILSFYETVNYSRNEVIEHQGFFDVKLKHSFSNRARGHYDGKIGDTTISRSNQFLGSEVFAGYRKSTGNFPIYENGDITNGQGEYYAGVKLSLLRNRNIDDNRLKLLLSRLDLKENKAQLEYIKNQITQDALNYYWKWVISGNVYDLYKELYELAVQRQEKMEYLFKKGDISEIVLIENERNILNRKRRLISSQRLFENNSIYLTLFLRDASGEPIKANKLKSQIINLKQDIKLPSPESLDKDLTFALANRPDIEILRIKTQKERQKVKQAENLNKPGFDISFKASKDEGNGPLLRDDSENIIKAEIEIPFQRRLARGQIGKYNSSLKNLKHQSQLLSQEIKVEIKQLENSIHHSTNIYKNISREVELSEILQKSEVIKLKRGRSSFFLINLREQELFNARLALLQIYEQYQDFLIRYRASTFRLLD